MTRLSTRRISAVAIAILCSLALISGASDAQSVVSGPYAGIAAGYGMTELHTRKTVTAPPEDQIGSDVHGFAGTVFAGYNLGIGHHVVLGVEADATVTDWSGIFHNDDYNLRWNATLRARLGYELSRHVLVYMTGGAGWLHTNISPDHFGSFDKTLTGYVVGGGLEYAWHPNFRLRVEYLYSNYASWSFSPTQLVNETLNPETHQVRVGFVIPVTY